jgi:hypothetical protein
MEEWNMARKDLGQPLDIKDAIERLAQPDYLVRIENQGEYDGYRIWIKRTEGIEITQRELDMLIINGWLEPYGAQGGYQLSDEGKKAWLRSTDELGDGKLRSPASGSGGT